MPTINLVKPGTKGAYTAQGGCLEFLHSKDYMVFLAGSSGSGKSQPTDRCVLTPSGWKRIGSLRLGDQIININGTISHVSGIFPQGLLEVFGITCSDGAYTESSGDHLWTTLIFKIRTTIPYTEKVNLANFTVKTLDEIRHTIKDRHYLPIAPYVQLMEQDLPITPYVLGVLLGDGSISGRTTVFNTVDEEIVDRVRQELDSTYDLYNAANSKGCPTYCIVRNSTDVLPLKSILNSLGLHGLTSYYKFIPEIYLTSNLDDRIALLQGLMDTDGTVTTNRGIQFSTSSELLARDIKNLVRSLGGTATQRSKIPTYLYKGERRYGSRSFTLQITLPNNIPPFHLKRKLIKVRMRTKYFPYREIIDIKSVGIKECICISTDAPDSLYITDDFIVTHNTTSGCVKLVSLCLKYPGIKILFTRKSYRALVKSGVETLENVLREIFGMEIGKGPNKVRRLGETEPREFTFPYAKRIAPYGDDPNHVYEGRSRVLLASLDKVYDEMGSEYDFIYVNQPEEITEADWQFLATRANGRRGHSPFPQLWGDPNPQHTRHWIKAGSYQIIDGEKSPESGRWRLIPSTYKDNPVLFDLDTNQLTTKGEEQIGRLRQSLNMVMTKRLIEGEWTDASGLVYGDSWNPDKHIISEKQYDEYQVDSTWPRYWAIDWGLVDPFVCAFWAKHPTQELYIRYKLIYMSGRSILENAQTILEVTAGDPRPIAIIGDRSPQENILLSQAIGMNIITAKKGAGSIKSGINIITDMLRKNQLLFKEGALVEVDESLRFRKKPIGLEEEIEAYSWNTNLKRTNEEPVGGDDHELDAARYIFSYLKANTRVISAIWI